MDKVRSKLCGERLKEVIKENGYTQERFAREVMIGMNPKYLSLIIRGDRQLTDEQAKRTVEHFPYIHFAWLKGVSNIKTVEEYKRKWDQEYGEAFARTHNKFNSTEALIKSFGYDIQSEQITQNDFEYKLIDIDSDACVCVLNSKEYKNLLESIFDFVEGQLLLRFHRAQERDG